ncbi:hypothetical protein Tco_1574065, partial [Tanacetum coccineum]
EEEEEEEEHLALANSAVVVPTVEPDHCRASGFHKRLLAMPTPPPSPPISLLPPSARERLARCTTTSAHSSTPPVPSPLLPSSGCPTQIQTLRIASTQTLVDAALGMRSRRVLLLDLPEVEGDTWVDLAEAVPEIAPMTMGKVNTRVTDLAEIHEHDTQDLYALLEDAQGVGLAYHSESL